MFIVPTLHKLSSQINDFAWINPGVYSYIFTPDFNKGLYESLVNQETIFLSYIPGVIILTSIPFSAA